MIVFIHLETQYINTENITILEVDEDLFSGVDHWLVCLFLFLSSVLVHGKQVWIHVGG